MASVIQGGKLDCTISFDFYIVWQVCYNFVCTSALHKAGKHMENSIVAAYVALLVGCLIQENEVS